MKTYKLTSLILLLTIIVAKPLIAGNTLTIVSTQSNVNDTATITVNMDNDSAIVAFQIDIPLPGQLTYIDTSALLNPSRTTNHTLQAKVIDGDTLRLFGYSNTNTPFTGNSGTIVTFKLLTGTIPGTYPLTMYNPLMGDTSSTNLITGHTDGNVTILGPNINLSTTSLNFGRVPLLDSTDQSLTINNIGNQDLNIQSINFDTTYFSVVGNSTFTIPAGQSQTVNVRFNSVVKGTYNNTMTIISNDYDESSATVNLTVVAYPVNELHTGSLSVYSGDYTRLDFTMNNMEPLTGIQFDLTLPDPMTFVPDSMFLTGRKDDHTISANMISSNTLRVVVYSGDNKSFSGNDGLILQLGFNIEGTGGYYDLNINNVVLGDTNAMNAISASYNGSLQIAAADIYANTSLNFGNVSILDSSSQNIVINNYGNDTLKITSAQSINSSFRTWQSFPLNVLPYQSQTISVVFSNSTEGNYSGTMHLFSNDPDESPYSISLSAYAYIPNYIVIKDSTYNPQDTIFVDIKVNNLEPFTGFQFDLHHTDTLTCLPNNIHLGQRVGNHSVNVSELDSTTVRIVVYSTSNSVITGNNGTIVSVPFLADSGVYGTVPLSLDSVVLGNSQSENILWGITNHSIVIGRPQEIILNEGWNIFSLNHTPYYLNMDSILSNQIADTTLVKVLDEEGNFIQYIPGTGWFNTIGNMALTEGYYIKVNQTDTLFSFGNPAVSPFTIPLQTGWNIIGYPLVNSQDALQTMQPLINSNALYKLMDEQGDFIQNIPGIGWLNTIGNLSAGEGYYLKANSDANLVLTESTAKIATANNENSSSLVYFNPVQGTMVYNPMNFVITLKKENNSIITKGDEMAVFDGQLCVGASVIESDNQDYITITTSMKDNPDLDNGYKTGDSFSFKFWDNENNDLYINVTPGNQNNTSVFIPLETYIGVLPTNALGIIQHNNNNDLLNVAISPNPVRNNLNLNFFLKKQADLETTIYDLSGQKLQTNRFLNIKSGKHLKTISVNKLSKGIYFIKTTATFNNNTIAVQQAKFVKIN